MSDYTPTTEDIRAAYENRAAIGPPAMAADYEEAAAQFDRWLASVRAEAWDGGFRSGVAYQVDDNDAWRNPYRGVIYG